jgi:small neutral amino acid transporter SnatA (MarC family)
LELTFFVTLFSVLNPAHAVPLYLSMVGIPTPADRPDGDG